MWEDLNSITFYFILIVLDLMSKRIFLFFSNISLCHCMINWWCILVRMLKSISSYVNPYSMNELTIGVLPQVVLVKTPLLYARNPLTTSKATLTGLTNATACWSSSSAPCNLVKISGNRIHVSELYAYGLEYLSVKHHITKWRFYL